MIHFEVTSQDLSLISPLLWIGVTALLVLVVDLFRFDRENKNFAFHLSWAGIVVAFLYDLFLMSNDIRHQAAFGGLIQSDRLAQVFIALILISALLAVFLSRSFMKRAGVVLAEYYVMLLAVVMGMIIIAMAGDLIVLFLGVELLSIPLYVLAAFLRDRRLSVEAGLKYFLLGAFASGFLLYGIVLLYGATGTTSIPQMVTALSREALSGLSLVGFALIAVGLAFKIAAVPFHMWAPDVYEGAPTPITAFMATGVKIAGFAAIIRIFAYLNTSANEVLALGAAWLAVLTMIVGNLGALPQTNIKRMLAFSSVAHAGYLDMAGLAQKHQGIALPMAIFMFTLAGLPPSAGFFGKFYLFKAAVDAGMIWLAVIAVIMSVVSLYYYLRVITTMYLISAADDSTEVEFNFCPALVTLISVAGVLILGIFPAFGLNILQSIF
jgi:NADH-quinone oxidoreductase subunit N